MVEVWGRFNVSCIETDIVLFYEYAALFFLYMTKTYAIMNVRHRTQCNREAQGAEVGRIHTSNSERWLSGL